MSETTTVRTTQVHEVTNADAGDAVDRHRRTLRQRPVVAIRVHRKGEEPLVLSLKRVRSTLLIGRGEGVECRLADHNISRIHGFLRGDDDVWSYVDVGGANGSYLMEGERRHRLEPGRPHLLVVGIDIHLARDNRIEPLDALPRSKVNADTRSTAGLEFEGLLQATGPSRLPVFLLGPSGSGKTWAARTLHELGRQGKPFVALNCARLPVDPTQLQSFLIGHVKGAFTGADRDHVGAFFEAAGGTLFLDEVESLSPTAQGFLLDLLEESGQLRRLGSQQVLARPDVRIVSASKSDLRRSALRNDLCHRLAAGEVIRVPRLGERRADIPGLIEGFAKEGAGDERVTFSPEALRALVDAPWTGEVRELEGTVKLLIDRALRAGSGLIDLEDVRRRLHSLELAHGFEPAPAFDDDELTAQDLRPPTGTWSRAGDTLVPRDRNPRRLSRADVVAALEATGGNIEQAARRVGCVRNTFTKKMDEFGIARPARP